MPEFFNQFLKMFTEYASTTFVGSEFQLSITRMLKLLTRTFSLERLLNSFNGYRSTCGLKGCHLKQLFLVGEVSIVHDFIHFHHACPFASVFQRR